MLHKDYYDKSPTHRASLRPKPADDFKWLVESSRASRVPSHVFSYSVCSGTHNFIKTYKQTQALGSYSQKTTAWLSSWSKYWQKFINELSQICQKKRKIGYALGYSWLQQAFTTAFIWSCPSSLSNYQYAELAGLKMPLLQNTTIRHLHSGAFTADCSISRGDNQNVFFFKYTKPPPPKKEEYSFWTRSYIKAISIIISITALSCWQASTC